ncbi:MULTISPECIES: GNAT family N-acetyltransferase [Nocardiopsis]|jgi:ribosomal protein S18 acetylase RimI-like enzyme|uniref:GNAT family N-acetyltransferase n=1 Tax=Nocardiopsis alba TaxID=53437 RepID=A0A7K2IPX8_9ACTN|nr:MULTISPECIES: GNAT family N-acetyltransferase [Nocardiopsis]MEC3893172.1 GNAT family N-acetyltransferase [Nocardiopsis sp. LDBS1602]MYR31936.1 GNAT family N-acetyltransferase [Nocardiopsis alba]
MIRPARPDDVPDIHRMIGELAEYEKEPDAVVATEEDLRTALFGPEPAVFAHVAEHTGEDGVTVTAGFALWFLTYSTWTGRHGIHLEDLYVRPELRGHGHGGDLLRNLARICVERGLTRLEWSVLDWNTPAIRFYESLGSTPMDEWTVRRLDGDALVSLGSVRA